MISPCGYIKVYGSKHDMIRAAARRLALQRYLSVNEAEPLAFSIVVRRDFRVWAAIFTPFSKWVLLGAVAGGSITEIRCCCVAISSFTKHVELSA